MITTLLPENLLARKAWPVYYEEFLLYLNQHSEPFIDLEIQVNGQRLIKELTNNEIPHLEYFATHGSGSILCFDCRMEDTSKWPVYWIDSGGGYSGLIATNFQVFLSWQPLGISTIYSLAKKCSSINQDDNLSDFIQDKFPSDWYSENTKNALINHNDLILFLNYLSNDLKIQFDQNPTQSCANMFYNSHDLMTIY